MNEMAEGLFLRFTPSFLFPPLLFAMLLVMALLNVWRQVLRSNGYLVAPLATSTMNASSSANDLRTSIDTVLNNLNYATCAIA